MTEEQYYLLCFAEECNEASHRILKAIRFGLFEVQPRQEFTNRDRIQQECQDLFAVEQILIQKQILAPYSLTHEIIETKHNKIKKFMDISIREGVFVPND